MDGRGRAERVYMAHVVPGLEALATRDLRRHLGSVDVIQTLRRFDERTSIIVFRWRGPVGDLLALRSTEDVFALAAEGTGVPSGRSGPAAIRNLLSQSELFPEAVTAVTQVRPRKTRRVTVRVIARSAGDHAYRRVDVQRAAERALQERFPSWRLVEDNAQIELWVQVVRDRCLAGLRLSDITMRQRAAGRVSLPAALKPSIAYAMVQLSDPADNDVFLDPMCGSGTIVLERAEVARYRLLLCGDINPEAVATTRQNVGPRYKPIRIEHWDARHLPLAPQSVDVIVCNLPFGRQIGTPEENRSLYPALLSEWQRVLAPRGLMVLLSSDRRAQRQALQVRQGLQVRSRTPVLIRGLDAEIVVLTRNDAPGAAGILKSE